MISHNSLFKALADETRLRCLVLLSRQNNLCVCELCHASELSQPKISRHLSSLRAQGLVVDHRQGQWVFYEISSDLPQWFKDILGTTADALHTHDLFAADEARLLNMQNRPERSAAA